MSGTRQWGLREVSVWYGSGLALDRVSLAVPAGQVTAVVGGDGAGKTTLLRCLAGAQAPGSGQVSRPDRAQTGYLPATSGVYPDLTVAENLAFRAAVYGLTAAQARTRAGEYLERAGLAAAANRPASQLSGGMRQKLGMIAAMVHQPRLLVLDEPTTGVDPVSRSDLWWLVARAAAAGAAVVLATTYLDEAERAEMVLALDDGRQLAAGAPGEIVAGMPGTLRAARRRPDGADRGRAWRRDGRWRVWDPGGPVSPVAPRGSVPGRSVLGGSEPAGSVSGGSGPAAGEGGVVRPDLQDAVTVAALARELQYAGRAA
ncbi:MAG TPA: ABC transporter ATP-binding protein [Streptosporangiaceae bacterium]|jgi:ABC-2 type transport system ATP-binding protein